MASHMHDDTETVQGTKQVPNPFLVDDDALCRPSRSTESRVKWRSAMLAIARGMLVEDGYRSFSLRRLSVKGNSSPQNIYNNLGAKNDVILQALLSYNRALLTLDAHPYDRANAYVRLIVARHQTTIKFPEYAKAVHDTLFSSPELSRAMQTETIHHIAPYVKSVLRDNGAHSVDPMRISRILAGVARNAARDWNDGACTADDMLRNSIADGELCLLGALLKGSGAANLYDHGLGFKAAGLRH